MKNQRQEYRRQKSEGLVTISKIFWSSIKPLYKMGTAMSFCHMFSTPLSLPSWVPESMSLSCACKLPELVTSVPQARDAPSIMVNNGPIPWHCNIYNGQWLHHTMKLVWEQHENYIRTRRKQLGNVMWTWWEHQNKIMETSLEHGNIMGMWKLNMRTTSFVNTYSSTLKDYAIYCSTPEGYELCHSSDMGKGPH